ncbi:hypothetical protein LZ32DRAFT_255033 [Colletotrichum eremochloae]|nr:hypothetical protein LZ32DRAFT_255033 [Colletotrichum eremochloae]
MIDSSSPSTEALPSQDLGVQAASAYSQARQAAHAFDDEQQQPGFQQTVHGGGEETLPERTTGSSAMVAFMNSVQEDPRNLGRDFLDAGLLTPASSLQQVEMDSAQNDTEVEVSNKLFGLLFALTSARDEFRSKGSNERGWYGSRASLETVLGVVSTLCDMLPGLRNWRSIGHFGRKSPCLMVAISLVSTVVDIYHYVVECMKDKQQSCLGISPSQPSMHEALREYSDISAMEFHLAHLENGLGNLSVDYVGSQTHSRLQGVRQTLQQVLLEYRTGRVAIPRTV